MPVAVEAHERRHPDDREVAGPAGELLDRPSRARDDGHRDLRQQLVGRERGGEIAAEELARGHRPVPRGGRERQVGVERHHGHRQLGRGIGVGEASAQGAERPHADVADEPSGLAEQRATRLADLKNAYLATLEVLTFHIESADTNQEGHATRVAELAAAMGAELKLTEGELENLRIASLLHEVGTADQRLLKMLSRSVCRKMGDRKVQTIVRSIATRDCPSSSA